MNTPRAEVGVTRQERKKERIKERQRTITGCYSMPRFVFFCSLNKEHDLCFCLVGSWTKLLL